MALRLPRLYTNAPVEYCSQMKPLSLLLHFRACTFLCSPRHVGNQYICAFADMTATRILLATIVKAKLVRTPSGSCSLRLRLCSDCF